MNSHLMPTTVGELQVEEDPEFKRQEKILVEENKKRRKDKDDRIVVNTVFTRALCENVFFRLKKAEEDSNIEKVKIFINSPGGSVYALMPMIDQIEAMDTTVETIGMGHALSAGAMLLLSGDVMHRKAYKHCEILLHDVQGDIGRETPAQAEHYFENLRDTNEVLKELLEKRTEMEEDEIEHYMDSNIDDYIDAEQALDFCIIDEII